MRTNSLARLVVAGTAAMLLLAACGGGGGGSKASKKDQQQFTDLTNKAKTAAYRVTYASIDENGTVGTDTWTYSQQSDTKKAYINGSSKIVVDGDKAWNCTDLDTTPSCDEVPGGSQGVAGLVTGFAGLLTQYNTALASDIAGAGFTDKSTQTIAGRQATCWKWSIGGAAGSGIAKSILNATGIGKVGWETCVDNDSGVALQVKYTGPGSTGKAGIVVTKYEQPQDADFATPTTTTVPDNSGGSTDTTETTPSGETSTTTSGGGSTDTTTCISVPSVSLPTGVTMPCIPAP